MLFPHSDLEPAMTARHTRVLILGSGPAGYTAAIYASRANLKPVLYTGIQMGGQLTTTTEVDNFPGYPEGITGPQMMEDLKKQAERFGADIRFGIATAADFSGETHKVTIDENKVIEADTVIISTGATAKYLGLDAEKKYAGQGVSACATCDGFFYRGKDVAVVGGGDTAAEEALFISRFASKVYLVHRRDRLRATKVLQDRILAHAKIEPVWNSVISEVVGDQSGVTGLVLADPEGGNRRTLEVAGLFVAIGVVPKAHFLAGILDLDAEGYILTDAECRTSIPGVFAAGDVRKKILKQIATAVGDGAVAAIVAEKYLDELD